VVELRGGPRGPDPPERPGGPSKHLVWEGTRGPFRDTEITRQMQHINIILSTDGDAPSQAT